MARPLAGRGIASGFTRTFHQVSPENELRSDVHGFGSEWAVGTIRSAGIHGRWRAPCGHPALPLRAYRPDYWREAGCAACLAIRRAIIP